MNSASAQDLASGGPLSYRLEPVKLGIVLFIALETMLFAGLISAFLMFRLSPAPWPPAGQPRFPLVITALNTFFLILSGFTFQKARRALGERRYISFLRGIEATVWLGFLFLAVQGTEWFRLLHYGLTLSGAFGGFFYLLVGLHGLHVMGGLAALFWMKSRASRGDYVGGRFLEVDVCGIYWFFVVGLWPVLFLLLYF
jgi:cytochrome c oxidase subunit 3